MAFSGTTSVNSLSAIDLYADSESLSGASAKPMSLPAAVARSLRVDAAWAGIATAAPTAMVAARATAAVRSAERRGVGATGMGVLLVEPVPDRRVVAAGPGPRGTEAFQSRRSGCFDTRRGTGALDGALRSIRLHGPQVSREAVGGRRSTGAARRARGGRGVGVAVPRAGRPHAQVPARRRLGRAQHPGVRRALHALGLPGRHGP